MEIPVKTAERINSQCKENLPLFKGAYDAESVGQVVEGLTLRALEWINKNIKVEMTGETIVDVKPEKEISESLKAVRESLHRKPD